MSERFYFAGIGLFGVVSIIPNVMFVTSSSKPAMVTGRIGLIASSLVIMSGITGTFHGVYIPIELSQNLLKCAFLTQFAATWVCTSLVIKK
jgi:hypothetical protein